MTGEWGYDTFMRPVQRVSAEMSQRQRYSWYPEKEADLATEQTLSVNSGTAIDLRTLGGVTMYGGGSWMRGC